jgi:circadian clock protein KaiC
MGNADGWGQHLDTLVTEGRLYFHEACSDIMAARAENFDLNTTLSFIANKAQQMKAKLVVLDSLDSLPLLLMNAIHMRMACRQLHDWLRRNGLTCIVTARTGSSCEMRDASKRFMDVMHYMADCVAMFQHERRANQPTRHIRILKYGASPCVVNAFSVAIDDSGVSISGNEGRTMRKQPAMQCGECISSGIPSLDALLCGGYRRGESVLLSGAPGIGKTTLAAQFAMSACVRGEKTLYVSFNQPAWAFVRNMRAAGIPLQPHVEAGALAIHATKFAAHRATEQVKEIKALVRRHHPRCLVIDGLPVVAEAISELSFADQIRRHTWQPGITTVFTCMARDSNPFKDAAAVHVSPVAGTWIHLSWQLRVHGYKRALLIAKASGEKAPHRTHELLLDASGIVLKDADPSLDHDLPQAHDRQYQSSPVLFSAIGPLRRFKEKHAGIPLLLARQRGGKSNEILSRAE